MASLMTVRNFPFSNSYMAEAVVAAGEVTELQRTVGCSFVVMAKLVEPRRVWCTRVVVSRENPCGYGVASIYHGSGKKVRDE